MIASISLPQSALNFFRNRSNTKNHKINAFEERHTKNATNNHLNVTSSRTELFHIPEQDISTRKRCIHGIANFKHNSWNIPNALLRYTYKVIPWHEKVLYINTGIIMYHNLHNTYRTINTPMAPWKTSCTLYILQRKIRC